MRWTVTDNIYVETWRQILEFANAELTVDRIARRHGAPKSAAHARNYAKQAAQARVCVLQAKEYFDAARTASLFTSPNHAYYGAIALASLCLLILGDGTKSLDKLRATVSNRHHGLIFTTAATAASAVHGVTLLDESFVEPQPAGHFANWYKALPNHGPVYAHKRVVHGPTYSKTYSFVGYYPVEAYSEVCGKRKSITQLARFLPDLDDDLQRSGIGAIRSRTTHEHELAADGTQKHKWSIHSCGSSGAREQLLAEFLIAPSAVENVSCVMAEDTASAIVTIRHAKDERPRFRWPNCRDTLNHDSISYVGAPDSHEITDLYQIAFQLSMLSRYYPDVWVACLESRCRAAKIIERTVEIIIKKLPILALSAVLGETVIISTHREPWLQ